MIRPALIALTLAALTVAPACDDGFGGSCTLIGCADSLTIRLVQTSAPLADGDYVLTVTDNANGDARTCEIALKQGEIFSVSGCSQGLGADTVSLFDFVPTDATLAFADVTTSVAETTVAISYAESRPNGPDCGPVCYQAEPVAFELAP